ncbi:MAG: tRNA (N(6)-L-threonylcarbamoyladenosine(37)-C(2))-methylthiotransferase MtaB [Rhodospirillaceae bacterium]|nr:tRNA (N(6)-L-threonylcarbamoyladenosine(37)-C(2))-methylthiotransferase MtaB [Rhodospirillaceae bacterium]
MTASAKPTIITFGCRLNAYEAQVISNQAAVDAIIVNTCAVTAEAERQARQAVRRARRMQQDARIIVTGCSAQIDPASWSAMPEVDQVIGNAEKLKAQTFLPTNDEPVQVNDIMTLRETASHLVGGFDGRARAYVQVQNGCDHRCTFCVIPYGRGNSRSVALGSIVRQVRALVENGYREIVLTGVDITSYGSDLPGKPALGQMVKRLLNAVPDLERLRLTSLDSCEVDNTLFRLIAEEPRLMPHFHLSLQAGDDMILKRMKRRHDRQQAVDYCQRIRDVRPDVAFGADLIAGFPTETEEMFQRSLALVDDCGLQFLHVFPYSERPGTPAAKMPAVPKSVRKERAAQLRAKGRVALTTWLDGQIGKCLSVLVEDNGRGRSEHYAKVRFEGEYPIGSVAPMRVIGTERQILIAVPGAEQMKKPVAPAQPATEKTGTLGQTNDPHCPSSHR